MIITTKLIKFIKPFYNAIVMLLYTEVLTRNKQHEFRWKDYTERTRISIERLIEMNLNENVNLPLRAPHIFAIEGTDTRRPLKIHDFIGLYGHGIFVPFDPWRNSFSFSPKNLLTIQSLSSDGADTRTYTLIDKNNTEPTPSHTGWLALESILESKPGWEQYAVTLNFLPIIVLLAARKCFWKWNR